MSNKIDVKRLKNSLTISDYEKIFTSLDIPIYSKSDRFWKLYTGCHHKNALHGSPKLLFYPDTGLCQCLTQCSCTTDIIQLVQKRLTILKKNHSFIDSIYTILNITHKNVESITRIHNKKYTYHWEEDLNKFIRFRKTGESLKIYNKNFLKDFDQLYPISWIQEGISIESMKKYQIRYYERLNQTIIPCFNQNGDLIGVRVRNWDADKIEHTKYMPLILLDNTSYAFNINDVFYGINFNWGTIEKKQHVILVEGEKSVLKADTWFNDESNVLALYGSQLGIKRRNQLLQLGVKHVTLALDSDFYTDNEQSDILYTKFIDKLLKIGQLFKNYCSVDVIYNNLGLDAYKCSPFDFDLQTYNKLFENRQPIDFYQNDKKKMYKHYFN